MRGPCALVAVAMLAGCVAPPPPGRIAAPAGPDRLLVAEAVSMAADQIRRCYRAPPVQRLARYVTTTLRVRYAQDGTLIGLPEVLAQQGVTAENRIDAGRMAEAASLAVIRCAPVRLPAALYAGGWDRFELTFSRRAVA